MVPASHQRAGPLQPPDDQIRAGPGPGAPGVRRQGVPRPPTLHRQHRLLLQTVRGSGAGDGRSALARVETLTSA